MGGGGLLGGITGALFGSPQQVATPDYTGAAQATAAGNLDAARAATAANRVNQVTPYGNLTYAVTGKDPYGNPTWTSTTSLSPEQQQLYNYDVQSSLGLGALQNKGLGYVENMLNQPFDTSKLPQLASQLNQPNLQTSIDTNPYLQQQFNQNANLQTSLADQGMQGWDRATGLVMQRLQPQIERETKQLDTQLAQQGIMPGSEAYNVAKQQLAQSQNDLMNQAQLTGLGAQQQFFGQGLQAGQFGNEAQQQMLQNAMANAQFNNQANQTNFGNTLAAAQFGNTAQQQMLANQLQQANLANQARSQGFQETAYQRNEPINTLNAVRSGSQVTNPNQFYTNAPQQQTTAGTDYLGAMGLANQSDIANANAINAQRNSMISGLFRLGSAAMPTK